MISKFVIPRRQSTARGNFSGFSCTIIRRNFHPKRKPREQLRDHDRELKDHGRLLSSSFPPVFDRARAAAEVACWSQLTSDGACITVSYALYLSPRSVYFLAVLKCVHADQLIDYRCHDSRFFSVQANDAIMTQK